jgi:hypothetical protein
VGVVWNVGVGWVVGLTGEFRAVLEGIIFGQLLWLEGWWSG